IKSLNLEQVDVRKLQRKFYAGAASLELDVNNRIVIPSGLKDWAELSKEVILSGMDERIELWSAEKYLQASDMDAEEYEQLAARLMGGGYNSPDRAPDL
ncbi:UNVERIFIED_CONTAM: hypothetical protein GTU68_044766, partial [Idotea baltica]|nr:hypothetical protein [Idotea baltica]